MCLWWRERKVFNVTHNQYTEQGRIRNELARQQLEFFAKRLSRANNTALKENPSTLTNFGQLLALVDSANEIWLTNRPPCLLLAACKALSLISRANGTSPIFNRADVASSSRNSNRGALQPEKFRTLRPANEGLHRHQRRKRISGRSPFPELSDFTNRPYRE